MVSTNTRSSSPENRSRSWKKSSRSSSWRIAASHGTRAVEVVQRQVVEAGRLDRLRPRGALQVRARGAQPLQGQREGHPLGVEAEPAALGQAAEDLRQALPLPQPAEDQGRAPALGLPGDEALVLGRLDHPQPGAEAGQRLEQLVELAGGHQQIAAAEARHQLLAHPRAVAHRAHDLQVLVAPAVLYDRLDPHEHPSAHANLPRRRQDQSLYNFHLPLLEIASELVRVQLPPFAAFCRRLRIPCLRFTFRLTSPPSSSIAPPGNYLLFALDDRRVPSVGRFIRIDRQFVGELQQEAEDFTTRGAVPVTVQDDGTVALAARREPIEILSPS